MDVVDSQNILVPFNFIGVIPKAISFAINDQQVTIVDPNAQQVELDLSSYPNGMPV